MGLDDILTMAGPKETEIKTFRCIGGCATAVDVNGIQVPANAVKGTGLKVPHQHPVQVFFIGVGEADLQVGRIIAEATGAEYQGTTEEDLATVLTQSGDYF
jgi:hypothetical protein